MGQILDFVSRSAFVFLAGPGAIPALVAALASYTLGMVAREGLLGADYDLISKQNVGTLVSEVGASAFDFLKLEDAIKSMLLPKDLAAFAAMSKVERNARQFGVEFLKASGSKLFEKVPQNLVLQEPFPAGRQVGDRAFHAVLLAGMKVGTTPLIKSPGLFESYYDRVGKQMVKTAANGPPPKSAPIYAVGKELTDLFAGGWDNTSVLEKSSRFVKAAAVSVVSTIPASIALAGVGQREARRMTAHLDDAKIHAAVMADPIARRAYAQAWNEAKAARAEAPNPATWIRLAAEAGNELQYKPAGSKELKKFEPGVWLAAHVAEIDKTVEKPTFR